MMLVSVAILLLVSRACAQTVTILPSPLTGTEGSNLAINCSLVGGGRANFELTVNGTDITTLGKFVDASMTDVGTQFVYGPLERSESGIVFECDDGSTNRASGTLVVNWQPTVSLAANVSSLLEERSLNITYIVDLGHPPSVLRVVGPETTRVLFTNTGVLINNVNRRDNGSYTATWTNEVGAAMFTLDLEVTAERARESLPLNSCGSTTVISEIPGIEFPNPTVDCDNVTGVTVSDGSITVMCNGLATGQTNTIQCTSSNGVIIFQVSGAVPDINPTIGPEVIAGIVVAVVVVASLIIIAGGVGTGFMVRHLKKKHRDK